MQFLLRPALSIAIGLGATSGLANKAWTQVFPNKPIRFFVPFPAGGSTDAVARAMQPALEKILGQPVHGEFVNSRTNGAVRVVL